MTSEAQYNHARTLFRNVGGIAVVAQCRTNCSASGWLLAGVLAVCLLGRSTVGDEPADNRNAASRFVATTRVSIREGRWHINDRITYPGTVAEGLLLNVRMVNAVYEDRGRPEFDAEANTAEFLAHLADYRAHGVLAITLNLQGGDPGYEGAVNSAFRPDGTLRAEYLRRVQRVVQVCDQQGIVVILGCFYQRQDQILRDEEAVRTGVVEVARWIRESGFTNVLLEIANEHGHSGFNHRILKTSDGQIDLIRRAHQEAPQLLVSTSLLGHGRVTAELAAEVDFLLPHLNNIRVEDFARGLEALRKYGKPVLCNEDDKVGAEGARAAEVCVRLGCSWGFMQLRKNQHFPCRFAGAADDPEVYAALQRLATQGRDDDYFPPPESQGGWRTIADPASIERLAGMKPDALQELREWLLQSDQRDFAAVVIRRGYVVLEVERGNSSRTDVRRVASVSKAVCATVLAIAAELSRQGKTPRRFSFDDLAFEHLPQAQPLSDPRKTQITVRQLLNHTSGLCPEATGAPNDGTWEYVLGLSGDPRTARLAFDPGTAAGYSTQAFAHAALLCENVTGRPYDEFTVAELLRPIGCEQWWFQTYDSMGTLGRHPSHGIGLPARDLARIAYCLLRGGRWSNRQVVPAWFVTETAAATHTVTSRELRFHVPAQTYSHGWELPAQLDGEATRPPAERIPVDARFKPGSGGQLIAFVPSLDLVITRQTGSSGKWDYVEYLRRACAACRCDEKEGR